MNPAGFRRVALFLAVILFAAAVLPTPARAWGIVDWFLQNVPYYTQELIMGVTEWAAERVNDAVSPTLVFSQVNPCVYSTSGSCPDYKIPLFIGTITFRMPVDQVILKMNKTLIEMLLIFYVFAIIYNGAYIIFMAGSPHGRNMAKEMFVRLFTGLVLVSLSPILFQFLADIVRYVTSTIMSQALDSTYSGSSRLIYLFLDAKYCCAMFILLPITSIAAMIASFRYFLTYVMASFFPLILFMYYTDIPNPVISMRGLGTRFVRFTILLFMAQILQVLFLAVGLIIATTDTGGGASSRSLDFVLMTAAFAGVLLTPLIAMQLIQWVGAAIHISAARPSSPMSRFLGTWMRYGRLDTALVTSSGQFMIGHNMGEDVRGRSSAPSVGFSTVPNPGLFTVGNAPVMLGATGTPTGTGLGESLGGGEGESGMGAGGGAGGTAGGGGAGETAAGAQGGGAAPAESAMGRGVGTGAGGSMGTGIEESRTKVDTSAPPVGGGGGGGVFGGAGVGGRTPAGMVSAGGGFGQAVGGVAESSSTSQMTPPEEPIRLGVMGPEPTRHMEEGKAGSLGGGLGSPLTPVMVPVSGAGGEPAGAGAQQPGGIKVDQEKGPQAKAPPLPSGGASIRQSQLGRTSGGTVPGGQQQPGATPTPGGMSPQGGGEAGGPPQRGGQEQRGQGPKEAADYSGRRGRQVPSDSERPQQPGQAPKERRGREGEPSPGRVGGPVQPAPSGVMPEGGEPELPYAEPGAGMIGGPRPKPEGAARRPMEEKARAKPQPEAKAAAEGLRQKLKEASGRRMVYEKAKRDRIEAERRFAELGREGELEERRMVEAARRKAELDSLKEARRAEYEAKFAAEKADMDAREFARETLMRLGIGGEAADKLIQEAGRSERIWRDPGADPAHRIKPVDFAAMAAEASREATPQDRVRRMADYIGAYIRYEAACAAAGKEDAYDFWKLRSGVFTGEDGIPQHSTTGPLAHPLDALILLDSLGDWRRGPQEGIIHGASTRLPDEVTGYLPTADEGLEQLVAARRGVTPLQREALDIADRLSATARSAEVVALKLRGLSYAEASDSEAAKLSPMGPPRLQRLAKMSDVELSGLSASSGLSMERLNQLVERERSKQYLEKFVRNRPSEMTTVRYSTIHDLIKEKESLLAATGDRSVAEELDVLNGTMAASRTGIDPGIIYFDKGFKGRRAYAEADLGLHDAYGRYMWCSGRDADMSRTGLILISPKAGITAVRHEYEHFEDKQFYAMERIGGLEPSEAFRRYVGEINSNLLQVSSGKKNWGGVKKTLLGQYLGGEYQRLWKGAEKSGMSRERFGEIYKTAYEEAGDKLARSVDVVSRMQQSGFSDDTLKSLLLHTKDFEDVLLWEKVPEQILQSVGSGRVDQLIESLPRESLERLFPRDRQLTPGEFIHTLIIEYSNNVAPLELYQPPPSPKKVPTAGEAAAGPAVSPQVPGGTPAIGVAVGRPSVKAYAARTETTLPGRKPAAAPAAGGRRGRRRRLAVAAAKGGAAPSAAAAAAAGGGEGVAADEEEEEPDEQLDERVSDFKRAVGAYEEMKAAKGGKAAAESAQLRGPRETDVSLYDRTLDLLEQYRFMLGEIESNGGKVDDLMPQLDQMDSLLKMNDYSLLGERIIWVGGRIRIRYNIMLGRGKI